MAFSNRSFNLISSYRLKWIDVYKDSIIRHNEYLLSRLHPCHTSKGEMLKRGWKTQQMKILLAQVKKNVLISPPLEIL